MAIAGVRISSLRELFNADADDYVVINDVSAATTKKIRLDNLLSTATGNLRDSDTGVFSDNITTNDLNVNGDANITQVFSETVTFDNLRDAGENITITKLVDVADGIGSNNNDISIPTSAAVKAYADGVVSDYRLKTNIKEFSNSLDTLTKLDVYEYEIEGQNEIGVIAHEIEKILPHVVNGEKDALYEDGTEKYQTVNYAKIVPILIAAIQDLKAEIESLKGVEQ